MSAYLGMILTVRVFSTYDMGQDFQVVVDGSSLQTFKHHDVQGLPGASQSERIILAT